MRYHYCLLLLALTPLLTPLPSLAGNNVKFICNQTKINGKLVPVTYLRSQSKKTRIIIWEKKLGGQNPLQRCNQVTEKLQQAEDNNQLNMITTGRRNGQNVICTTDKYNGDCQIILLTLESGEKKWDTLEDLKSQLAMRSVGPMKNSSGDPQLYYQLDIQELLRNAPNE